MNKHKLLTIQSGSFKYYVCTKCDAEIWANIKDFESHRSLGFKNEIFEQSLKRKDFLRTEDSKALLSNNSVFIDGEVYLLTSEGRIYSKYTCWLSDEDVLAKEVIE